MIIIVVITVSQICLDCGTLFELWVECSFFYYLVGIIEFNQDVLGHLYIRSQILPLSVNTPSPDLQFYDLGVRLCLVFVPV